LFEILHKYYTQKSRMLYGYNKKPPLNFSPSMGAKSSGAVGWNPPTIVILNPDLNRDEESLKLICIIERSFPRRSRAAGSG
jgi:hypothetical protein